MKPWLQSLPLCLALLFGGVPSMAAETMNGFELSNATIPINEIHFGGPPKDGIPSIDQPEFVGAGAAAFLRTDDVILGVTIGAEARAYPLSILNWHEVVNDRFGTRPVVITYCPLCGTGAVFDASVNGRVLTFGVSGLLYNSDVLLYDRETQSLWSQLLGKAVSGPLKGQALTLLAVTQTTWPDWRKTHPTTRVLSPNTGQTRPYSRNPYAGYEATEDTYFPVKLPPDFRAIGLHPKERVIGITIDGKSKAYPFVELARSAAAFRDQLGTAPLTVRFDTAAQRATIHDAQGKQLPSIVGFWFAWYAFNPATAVYKAAMP